MNYSLRMKRLLVGSAAGAMVLATVPTGIAAAGVEEVCDGAPDNDFDDVADTNSHIENIDCLAAYAITIGTGDGDTYEPGEAVTRGQMATFIARFISQAEDGDLDFPTDSPDAFNDDDGTTHENAINYLADIDVVSGTSATTFEPGANVNRGQMARFIVQALDYLGVTLPDDAPNAFDDDDGTTHEDMIDILAELQIVAGFNDDTYRPGEDVSRQQMATYIIGAAGAVDDDPDVIWNGEFVNTTPVESNQTFDVTPSDDVTQDISEDDERQYTVSGLDNDETYDIALVLAEDITIDDDDVVSFDDSDDSDEYEPTASADADITVINGSSTATDATEVSPVNGQIQFTVTGSGFTEVAPVVWLDDEDDGNIELGEDDDDTPAADEPFGVGGAVLFIPAEAANGAFGDTVEFVDKDADFFVLDGERYNYADGDTYLYDDGAAASPSAASMAQFETALSVGDTVSGTYSQGFVSTFEIDADVPGVPENVTVTNTGDIDGDEDGNDVAVEWDAPDPPNGLIQEYEVSVASDTSEDDEAACTTTAGATTYTNDSPADDAEFTGTSAEVYDLANGDYCVQVRTVSQTDDDASTGGDADSVSAWTTAVAFTIQLGEADETAPTIDDLDFDGAGITMTAGDDIIFTFSEAMDTAAIEDGIFRFTDADGATFEIDCSDAASATCVLSDSDPGNDDLSDELTVTLVAGPEHVAGSDDMTGAQLDGELTVLSSGFRDIAGNQVDLAESADTTIDNEF